MQRKAIINTVVVLGAVAAGIFVSRRPWQVWQEQRRHTAEQVEEMRKSEKEREDLLRQDARLRSSIGKEELARSKGWMGPNEKPADPQ